MKLTVGKTHSTGRKLLLVFSLAVFMAGCASVDPAPFTDFTTSLQPLRSATDAQAGAAVTASRQELVKQVADGDRSPADLQLEFQSSNPFATGYGFAEDGEPNFAKFRRFQFGLSALNNAMIGYAQSLQMLAGGGEGGDILPSTAEFDQMARDLNANAGSAAAALKVGLDPGRQALLSTAAIQFFKAYIENKRRKDLLEAISVVQPQVAEFSRLARQAVHLLASLVETDYNKRILPLMTASPPNADAILSFNDATQLTLGTLQAMSNSYAALPAAHRDLMAAAAKKSTGLAGLIALGDAATRLNSLVTQLAQANTAAAAASNQ